MARCMASGSAQGTCPVRRSSGSKLRQKSRSINQYISKWTQAAYLREGLWKKDRTFSELRWRESIDDFTFALKSSRLVMEVRPTVSALRCFQTNSSGFRSGE